MYHKTYKSVALKSVYSIALAYNSEVMFEDFHVVETLCKGTSARCIGQIIDYLRWSLHALSRDIRLKLLITYWNRGVRFPARAGIFSLRHHDQGLICPRTKWIPAAVSPRVNRAVHVHPVSWFRVYGAFTSVSFTPSRCSA